MLWSHARARPFTALRWLNAFNLQNKMKSKDYHALKDEFLNKAVEKKEIIKQSQKVQTQAQKLAELNQQAEIKLQVQAKQIALAKADQREKQE